MTNSPYHLWATIKKFDLQNDEVHFWLIHLPQKVTRARFEALHQFKKERRLILQDILQRYVNKPIEIIENPNGKPYMDSQELSFSTSHSGEYLAIVIAKDPIGLDIEKFRQRDFLHFSQSFFDEAWRQQHLETLPYYLQGVRFYQEWVITEAWVKYLGESIFNFTPVNPSACDIQIFQAKVGLWGAIIQKHPISSIQKFEIDWHLEEDYYNALTLLHEKDLKKMLSCPNLKLYRLATIDSTQQFIKNLTSENTLVICQSEYQTHGRGRFGRTWESPHGVNLYFSIRYTLPCSPQKLEGLSLVVGLSIVQMLAKETGVLAKIKWPNDIYVQNKKLAGILIEITDIQTYQTRLIIGIGLNVNAKAKEIPDVGTSLFEITKKSYDKLHLLKQLLKNIREHLLKFEKEGFGGFIKEWQAYDMLYQTQVKTQTIQGTAKGVNEKGYLLIQDSKGLMHEVGSGDASIQSFSNQEKD